MSHSARKWFGVLTFAIITIGLFLGGSTMPSHAAQETATAAPADQTPAFQVIHMINATNGWAVTTSPDPNNDNPMIADLNVYAGRVGSVLHTQNGGKTWANVTPLTTASGSPAVEFGCDCTDNALAGTFFLDDSHAWVATDDAYVDQMFSGIAVSRTSASGNGWQRANQGINAPSVLFMSFIDPAHGWLLLGNVHPYTQTSDQPAILYQTTDGGSSWQRIADDGLHNFDGLGLLSDAVTGVTDMEHTGMIFESVNSGWMTVQTLEDSGALLHSTDGGKTWGVVKLQSAQSPQLPAAVMPGCILSGLRVYTPGTITLLAVCRDQNNEQVGLLYRSIDDGKTWQSNPLPGNFIYSYGNAPLQVFMISSTIGWAVSCDVSSDVMNGPHCSDNDLYPAFSLYQTKDAGKTWFKNAPVPDSLRPGLPIGTADSRIFTKFNFIDDHTGWAIDPTGGLFATTDAGITWTALPQLGALSPNAISTPISTSATSACPTSTPPQLVIGRQARITAGTPNNLRTMASATGELVGTIPGGADVAVLAGPICSGGFSWWQVAYQGQTGWTPESDGHMYFMLQKNPSQWTPQTQTFNGVDMMLVPKGCFNMGTSDSQAQTIIDQYVQSDQYSKTEAQSFLGNEQPMNKVCFDQPFWIDKTDVTNGQFRRLGGTAAQGSYFGGDNYPVGNITWFEARDYCEKQRGARLPTEAEWEYAARGPGSWLYPWGNDAPSVDRTVHETEQTAVVGSKPNGVSWVGALDMAGNVWQWTSTIFDQKRFPYPYKNDDGRNSIDDSKSERVIRGGSYYGGAGDDVRAAFRGSYTTKGSADVGFRCVRS